MRHLLRFCRKHELDSHLIDSKLSYTENKDYLKSLVPRSLSDWDSICKGDADRWLAAEQEYMERFPLENYISSRDKNDHSSEEFDRLCRYVQKNLSDSGVIPAHHLSPWDSESVAAEIVHNAWRQPAEHRRYKTADSLIGFAIKCPPDAIDRHHFSLRAYIARAK